MAKSPAERKAAQRQCQQEAGVTKIELLVDNQDLAMLKRNCALRRPGREPYVTSASFKNSDIIIP
ncbi:hypothetical protein [Xenorhabdus eapokensis]|uniref:Uncharacterized protein n=1 Tax=Xenorhabdus eapokensis TaxID=1873482 RepID=A0A1Q5TPJ7_9GAMM|nr:hypothetical protein [Xenorhabdus eapokensis]OKP02150.1 hypothetical protein Xedl_02512 [Xenorhabdus eapokensis]